MFYALGAYLVWGIAPLYFHALRGVHPVEILGHRIVWSVAFLVLVLSIRRELRPALRLLTSRAVGSLCVSSLLIGLNWLLFIYAIVSGRTLQASFGYFINPLVTIALGVFFLKERLSRTQVVCLSVAAIGVGIQLLGFGELPWLSLTMAISFALYAVLRKQGNVPPLPGLLVETILTMPFALVGFWWLHSTGRLVFPYAPGATQGLLAAAGVITAVPLLLFVAGTQRIPLSVLGFLQYIAPSLQFFMAVAVFGEPLSTAKLVSFACVWLSLALLLITPFVARPRAA